MAVAPYSQRPERKRWLRVDELPFGRTKTYQLLRRGVLNSVLVKDPGCKRGRRLIDGDALNAYLEALMDEQMKTSEQPVRTYRAC